MKSMINLVANKLSGKTAGIAVDCLMTDLSPLILRASKSQRAPMASNYLIRYKHI